MRMGEGYRKRHVDFVCLITDKKRGIQLFRSTAPREGLDREKMNIA